MLVIRLIALFSLGYLVACVQPISQSFLSEDDGLALIKPPEAGLYDNATYSPHFDLIRATREALDIEIYEMRDPDIRALLVDAGRRGVKIRVVIEPRPVGVSCDLFSDVTPVAGSCRDSWDFLNDLRSFGAEVRPFVKDLCGANGNCLQHGKLMISDRIHALVSTGNFNSSSFCNSNVTLSRCNKDLTIVTRERWAVAGLAKVFEHDFTGTPYSVESILGNATQSRISVSPIAKPAMVSLIESAEEMIEVQAQYMRDPTLNESLMRAAERGIRVNLTLASACSFGRVTPEAAVKLTENLLPLEQAGIDIRMFTSSNLIGGRPGYMHSKAILVDRARGWVGSINGSTASLVSNREFGVFFDNKSWIETLGSIVESDHLSTFNETWRTNVRCQGELSSVAQDN